MKKISLIITTLFILCLTIVKAQEFESIHKLISDTVVQVKEVPIGSIPMAAEESNQLIREIDQFLESPDQLTSMDSILSVYRLKIDSIQEIMTSEFLESSVYLDVERKNIDLQKYKTQLTDYNETTQSEIIKLQKENEMMQQLDLIWENTKSSDGYREVTQTIRTEINTLHNKIKSSKQVLQDTINKYLESQILINNQIAQIQEMLDKLIIQVQEQEKNLFIRNSVPLWDLLKPGQYEKYSKSDLANFFELKKRDIIEYYNFNKSQIYFALLWLFLIQVFFFYLKYQINRTEFEEELDKNQNTALRLLGSNWSTAMVLGLTIIYFTLTDRPIIITSILFLISLTPLYFLITNVVDKKYYFLTRVLFLIFLLTLLSEPFQDIVILRRIYFGILNLIILVWLINLLRKNWDHIFTIKFLISSAKLISRIFCVLLVISIIANIWGNFRFTVYVTYAIAGSFFYGLLVYLLYLIMLGVSTASLYSKSANELRIIKKFKDEITQKISSTLRIVLTLIYIGLVLRSFRIITDVFQFFIGIIDYPLNIGNFTFTMGDIFLFIIIILIARWIANFTVFILDEQILYKTGKKKDLVASVSSLVKFSIITIGFLIGVIAIGFELDKLTILISAFGVGIGFGLQNIFNNLVSGIIMVFERPLQVGDVIEVGQLIGEVKKIGIRSSVVRTFDGSEVIVPNGNLISNDLINWTHSDMQRRLIIKVAVKYGTDPQKVIDILVAVAEKNEHIIEKPKPYVLFKEFGDSALNFELRCWTDDFDNWIFIDSDLHVEVNNALRKAGITIPFPQRDLHVYSMEEGNIQKSISQKKK